MFEKFFIVTKDSRLYNDYWNYKNSLSRKNEIVKEFMSEQGIITNSYACTQNYFYIPIENEEKFSNQLCKKEFSNGLYLFKKNSQVLKAWKKKLEDENFKIIEKPYLGFYFKVYGKFSTRLFDYNNIIYCSISYECDNSDKDIPEGMQEIKASEFFKVIEDIEDI